MIDQIRQAAKSFEGIYKQYKISLRLTPEDYLELRMENQKTSDHYYLLVDHEYIKHDKDFSNIMEEPIDILGCFLHHFNNVTVQKDTINLRYEFGTIRKIVKNFIFKTERQILVKDTSSQVVSKMTEDLCLQLSLKNKRISQLQDKLKMEQMKFHDILERTKKEFNQKLSLKEAQRLQCEMNWKESQKMLNAKILQTQQMSNENERLKTKASTASIEANLLRQEFQKAFIYKKMYQIVEEERDAVSQLEGSLGRNRWKKIVSLKPNQNDVNVLGKVLSVSNSGKRLVVQIGDITGTVQAYLDQDRRIVVGNTIVLFDAEVNLHRQRIQLRNCNVTRINYEVPFVNTTNKMSQIQW